PIAPLELIVKVTICLLNSPKPPRPRKAAAPKPSKPAAEPEASHATVAHSASAEPGKQEARAKKAFSLQDTLVEKLEHLREALKEETARREAVEQQAAENARRRAKLEAAIEENQRSQESFRQLLEEARRLEEESAHGNEAAQKKLAGRTRALMA